VRPPKIIVVPGSYKSTLTSLEASGILTDILSTLLPRADVSRLVFADGGEGTLEAFQYNFGGEIRIYDVRGPLGRAVGAKTYWSGDLAVIESAQAVGYSQVPSAERNPWVASSFGVGQLIRRVVADGARKIYVTMGDSATMDIGLGMLAALGVKFFSSTCRIEEPVMKDMAAIRYFDASALGALRDVEIVGLGDTKDYLCGQDGQAEVYGNQKGLRPEDIRAADEALANFAELIGRYANMDVARLPMGSGSGGLGAAISAFFGKRLEHTLEYLTTRTDLEAKLATADLIITGEGRLDGQTKWGKVPHFMASISGATCIAIVGSYSAEGKRDLEDASRGGCAVVAMSQDSDVPKDRIAARMSLSDSAHAVGLLLRSGRYDTNSNSSAASLSAAGAVGSGKVVDEAPPPVGFWR
jgi:glycerate 2-kinase